MFIPLGPNLPEYVVPAGETRDRNAVMTVAVFCVSEPPYREREVDEISHAMRAAAAAVHSLRIVFLGKGTREAQDEIARAFAGIPVEVSNLGLCSLEDISRVLAESDATLCVRGKLNLRRGSALAGIASAVPVVGYSGAAEWPPLGGRDRIRSIRRQGSSRGGAYASPHGQKSPAAPSREKPARSAKVLFVGFDCSILYPRSQRVSRG